MLGLIALIIGAYALLALLDRLFPRIRLPPARRGRLVLALVFANTGLAHFYDARAMLELLPPFAPRPLATIYAGGVFEIAAALALLHPRLRRPAAWALIAFLVAAFPLNVYGALQRAEIGGHGMGPAYLLLRGPFQLLLLVMTAAFGLARRRGGAPARRRARRDRRSHLHGPEGCADAPPDSRASPFTPGEEREAPPPDPGPHPGAGCDWKPLRSVASSSGAGAPPHARGPPTPGAAARA